MNILRKAALALALASTLTLSGCYDSVKDIPIDPAVQAQVVKESQAEAIALVFAKSNEPANTYYISEQCILGFRGCVTKGRDANGQFIARPMSKSSCESMKDLVKRGTGKLYPWYVFDTSSCVTI